MRKPWRIFSRTFCAEAVIVIVIITWGMFSLVLVLVLVCVRARCVCVCVCVCVCACVRVCLGDVAVQRLGALEDHAQLRHLQTIINIQL